MRLWTALASGLACVSLCIAGASSLQSFLPETFLAGKAYITQAGVVAGSKEYDAAFGENWNSVRTFRLMNKLEKPLKVYIEARSDNLYKPHYRDYVMQSLQTWSAALNGRLTYTLTNNPREADITVAWVPAFSDRYVAGLTTYSVGHADVQIKTVGVPDKDIKCNIIHEFGHALGISGHSTHPADIMVGMRRWQRGPVQYDPMLSRQDVHAIRRLYSSAWRKGEDLYSSIAQSTPIPISPVSSTTTDANPSGI
jgi:hypothetical protein